MTMIVTVSHSVVIFCAEVGSLCYLQLCDASTLTWARKMYRIINREFPLNIRSSPKTHYSRERVQ